MLARLARVGLLRPNHAAASLPRTTPYPLLFAHLHPLPSPWASGLWFGRSLAPSGSLASADIPGQICKLEKQPEAMDPARLAQLIFSSTTPAYSACPLTSSIAFSSIHKQGPNNSIAHSSATRSVRCYHPFIISPDPSDQSSNSCSGTTPVPLPDLSG